MKYDYQHGNHASVDLKATAKRVRAVLDTKEQDGKRLIPGNPQTLRNLNPRERHKHCHSNVRSYGLGPTRTE